ncbi:MAG TPA: hypothetical protein VE377_23750 [Candidatus Dormibacteraeota bacterium]|nr:hypothetical protein [Candidatus Dormibacteraeota bacterium]
MKLKKEIEALFRPLAGQKAWGAKVGWGSFVTIEFGSRRLQHHHYHGDWHLWLYQCAWTLKSETHEMANSESKRGLMQTAIDNLNDRAVMEISFDQQQMATEFVFKGNLRLRCQPYTDAQPDEQCWMLFTPEKQVASLVADGLRYEPASDTPNKVREVSGQAANASRLVRFED